MIRVPIHDLEERRIGIAVWDAGQATLEEVVDNGHGARLRAGFEALAEGSRWEAIGPLEEGVKDGGELVEITGMATAESFEHALTYLSGLGVYPFWPGTERT